MRVLKRLLLGRRDRTVLWLASNLLPIRWLVSVLLVGRAKRTLRDAACEQTPLPRQTCLQVARGVRKTTVAKALTKQARKGVSRTLKQL
jgi:hypothetical protein